MNQNEPLVSVIIPNYNHAKYLPERIDSILNQTYRNFEIIILDDCSLDNSKDVIEGYSNNPHVSQVVFNNINSGSVFKQWRKGFDLSKGELIWIAESDDKCKPTLLEELVDEFVRDSKISLAFSRTMYFTDEREINLAYGAIKSDRTERLQGEHFIKKYMLDGCYVANASSALFKKDIAMSIDDIYMTYQNAGDRMFWIEIAEKGNVAIVHKALNYCRRHGNNLTDRYWVTGNIQKEEHRIFNYLKAHGMLSHRQAQIESAYYIFAHILNQELSSLTLKKELLELWEYDLLKRVIVSFYQCRQLCYKIKQHIS